MKKWYDIMNSEDVVEKALNLGFVYFKNEDYKNACNLFTKALRLALSYSQSKLEQIRESHGLSKRPFYETEKVVHPRFVKLLDNRAATWEKLGDLTKALKDANRAVKYEPYNLKCYLRKGKILQKLQLDDMALKNYEEGLQKADEMRSRYGLEPPQKLSRIVEHQKSLIKSRITETRDTVSSEEVSKRVLIPQRGTSAVRAKKKNSVATFQALDIVGQCPLEILRSIMICLDTKQISTCLLVSKLWLARILLLPDVFKRFDLRSSTQRKLASFYSFTERLFHGQEHTQIDWMRFSSSSGAAEGKMVSTLIRNLKTPVKSLIMHNRHSDFELLTSSLANNQRLAAGLEELSLTCDYVRSSEMSLELMFLSFLKGIRKLEFVLAGPASASRLKIRYSSDEIESFRKNLSNLTTLKLICDLRKVSPYFPFENVFTLGLFSRLEKLFICGVTFKPDMGFGWLTHFSNLTELWLENNKNAYLEDFFRVAVYELISSRLRKLTFREHRISRQAVNLRQYPQLTENSNLLHNFSSLEQLDLMSSSIGARGLLTVLSAISSSGLKKLNIGDCPYIHFQRSNDSACLDLKSLLLKLHHTEELYLHQSVSLDDYAVRELAKNIKHVKKLRKLDLSFNMAITGVSIFELVRSLKEEIIVLDELTVDGCPSISESTVSALNNCLFIKKLACSYEKLSWKTFGINSLDHAL